MRQVSAELRERLEAQKDKDARPPPTSSFVRVEWPLDTERKDTLRRCYSTVPFTVTMQRNRYEAGNQLLDFNEGEGEHLFVMREDDGHYGASCGFRVLDDEGLAQKVVRRANTSKEFPVIYCEAWWHVSTDAKETESLRYGMMIFGGCVTRVELQEDTNGKQVAKIWGGHEGVAVSKARPPTTAAASAVECRITWKRRTDRLFRRSYFSG